MCIRDRVSTQSTGIPQTNMEIPDLPEGDFPLDQPNEVWAEKLKPNEFSILRNAGTEGFARGEYHRSFPDSGFFACRACHLPLYSATSKFKDCGWDAYDKCYYTGARCHVRGKGPKHHMEAVCAGCGSHLGHAFFGEGHTETNERH
eukprot:TRINITY_DN3418_c0_g1_i2.p1 TRINITY_DN3418_c0_g1~~TRINITY_DN3418_c0_g1_i2.p1  ORF type:complete len:146 (+),score=30.22 TRINITY_DN3418_c0_g1_i2:188-625(+)